MTKHLKDLTEKQKKTYDLLKDFASNNTLPFSIKAYQIGEQVGYKVVSGKKEGYEPCCSGAESCMRALRDRELVDYDIRRHTGFIVKNVKSLIGEWMKISMNFSTHEEEYEYEYELADVITFDKDLIDKMREELREAKELQALDEGMIQSTEDSVKIKINETSEKEPQVSPGFEIIKASENNSSRLDILEEEMAILRYWKPKVESELITLTSRIDVLENTRINDGLETEEARYAIGLNRYDELSSSRQLVWDMIYLGRFFRTGVRKSNNILSKKPEWQEFSRISGVINSGVALRIESFQHKDLPVAEMSGAIVVVLNARDYPKFFISMNQEEKELFSQCSEMFSEFDINIFEFHSDSYCETRHWNIKRDQKLTASPSECSECHRNLDKLKELGIPIQIHHINSESYSRIFRENLEDLVVLCKECHEREHPKTLEDKDGIRS